MIEGFGFWLAGLIDGEGSFDIRRQSSGDSWQTSFRLALRGDDLPVLRLIHAQAGFGTITKRRWAGTEMATWNVYARRDGMHLAAILERHPLRSAKRRDFELWSQALKLPSYAPDTAALAAELRSGRQTHRLQQP